MNTAELSLVLATLCCGCVSAPPPEPTLLITPAQAGRDFLMRQKVEATFQGQRQGFEAAVQKRGDTLTVIGLTPWGTKAFVIVQKGWEVTFTSNMPKNKKLPLEPRYLLADVHHAFLVRSNRKGEVLEEEGGADGVRVRRFHTRGGRPAGQVVVTYEGGMRGDVPPRVTRIENGYYGYSLTIETITHQWLK